MKKTLLVLALGLALAIGFTLPASSADADKDVQVAVEKVLATLPADFYQVAPDAAKQQIENAKPFLLDVRETAEVAKGKIAGSVNIPLRELLKNLNKLPASKTSPILTYCAVGYRGGMSVIALRTLGYTNVRTIKGGLGEWEKAGLPVEK